MTRIVSTTGILMTTAVIGIGILLSDWIAVYYSDYRLSQLSAMHELAAEDLSGRRVSLPTNDRVIYFVFSPNCPASAAVASEWKNLLMDPRLSEHVIRGLVLASDTAEETQEFLASNGLNLETNRVAPNELYAVAEVDIVPSVIITDSTGRAIHVDRGVNHVETEGIAEIFSALGL